VVVSVAILIIAHIVGKFVSKLIIRVGKLSPQQLLEIAKKKNGPSETEQKTQINKLNLIFTTLGKISYYVIIVITFFIVLRILGIESASLIALIGTIGFSIGLAMQGTLSDISSGILMAFLQTFSIGEIIQINDLEGKVIDFNIVNTLIEDSDTGVAVTIPNRIIQDAILINHTRNPYRFVIYDFTVPTANENSVNKIMDNMKEYLFEKEFILNDPEPEVYVQEVTHFGTIIRVKAGIKSKDYEKYEDIIRTDLQKIFVENKK
jgi:small conductance mechanosensitive channel